MSDRLFSLAQEIEQIRQQAQSGWSETKAFDDDTLSNNRLAQLENQQAQMKQSAAPRNPSEARSRSAPSTRRSLSQQTSLLSEQFAYAVTTKDDWNNADKTAQEQYAQDAKLWTNTIYPPPAPADPRAEILKRIFTVFRIGRLQYRTAQTAPWKPWDKPLASALSHGGRVLIRIKRGIQREIGIQQRSTHEFWNWLVTGELQESQNPITTNELQRRESSTHGIEFTADGPTEVAGRAEGIRGYFFLDRNYGMNVALGGITGLGADNKPIAALGANGHLFLCYELAPEAKGYWESGILIGCETVAPDRFQGASGITGHLGTSHSWLGRKQSVSVTGGRKWKNVSGDPNGVPGEYNCMKVDIENLSVWTRIIEQARILHQADLESWLMEKLSDAAGGAAGLAGPPVPLTPPRS